MSASLTASPELQRLIARQQAERPSFAPAPHFATLEFVTSEFATSETDRRRR